MSFITRELVHYFSILAIFLRLSTLFPNRHYALQSKRLTFLIRGPCTRLGIIRDFQGKFNAFCIQSLRSLKVDGLDGILGSTKARLRFGNIISTAVPLTVLSAHSRTTLSTLSRGNSLEILQQIIWNHWLKVVKFIKNYRRNTLLALLLLNPPLHHTTMTTVTPIHRHRRLRLNRASLPLIFIFQTQILIIVL